MGFAREAIELVEITKLRGFFQGLNLPHDQYTADRQVNLIHFSFTPIAARKCIGDFLDGTRGRPAFQLTETAKSRQVRECGAILNC